MLDIRLETRYGRLGTVGTVRFVRLVRYGSVRLVRYAWYAYQPYRPYPETVPPYRTRLRGGSRRGRFGCTDTKVVLVHPKCPPLDPPLIWYGTVVRFIGTVQAYQQTVPTVPSIPTNGTNRTNNRTYQGKHISQPYRTIYSWNLAKPSSTYLGPS